jgi:hypothetical protein
VVATKIVRLGPYEDPRAHAVRLRYLDRYGGREIPVPVDRIAEDLLGLRVEESWELGEASGMLLPAERRILLNAEEGAHARNDLRSRRFRFTIAHEVGHWVCHCLEGAAASAEPTYCRQSDMARDAERALEREANVFAAELLMPEAPVRAAWVEVEDVDGCAARFDVSPGAMQWRLYNFGLVEERPA